MLLYPRHPGNSPHGEKYSSTPTVAKRAPKPKPAAASLSIPVADGQLCSSSGLCAIVQGSFTVSLFSIRGRRIADEWVQYIVKCAYLHQVHDTISIYARQRVCQSLWQHSNTEICLIDIMQHPQQHTHTPHAHMHARSHGCTLSFFGANIAAAQWLQCGIAWDCRCAECFFTPGTRVILPMVKSTAAHQQLLPNVHPNLSRLQPARPSLSLMGIIVICIIVICIIVLLMGTMGMGIGIDTHARYFSHPFFIPTDTPAHCLTFSVQETVLSS